MKSILVLEDSKDYQLMIQSSLQNHFEVSVYETVASAIEAISNKNFDLFLLDIVLQNSSGYEVCSFIKSQEHLNHLPVIMLSSKDSIDDKLKGFDYGADDYMTKPFDFRELIARIEAHTKKQQNPEVKLIKTHGFSIDISKQKFIDPDKKHIDLTRIEFKLLTYFCQNLDIVLTREMILDHAWPNDLSVGERTVDTHVSNLRKKTGQLGKKIKAVHGMGYKLCS